MKRAWLLAVLCLALALPALAAEKPAPLPKDLPPYGALVPFQAPKVVTRQLSNGLTVWLVPRPGFPKVALVLAMRGGMADDPKNLPGVSQLLLATVDQGTHTRNARQIAEAIQAAGGDLGGDARADALLITTDVLAPKTDAALEVLSDIVRGATFPDSEVALARRNAADSLRAQEAEPRFLANRALAKAIFGDHPYSVVAPTQDSIAKTDPETLRHEYAERFEPEHSLLVAVGDFDETRLFATIEKDFGAWYGPRVSAEALPPRPPFSNPHEVFLVPRPGSVQTTFVLGSFAPKRGAPDFPAAEVANAIYGGMFGSRLILNIREDKGYTYSPGAFIQLRRDVGVLQTRADVRNAVTGASLNEIDYELNRMATTEPGTDELARAKRYLVGVRALSLQSQESLASQLATLWTYNLPPEELGRESEEIQKVTAQDVEAAGRHYFPAARQTIVAVGDEQVIRKALAPFVLTFQEAPK